VKCELRQVVLRTKFPRPVMDPTCEVELVAGSADPIVLLLDSNVARSVGTRGHWRVWADGVLDVHGYFVWLETDLWVRSASRMQPVYVNGAPAIEWTVVPPGARIAMGSAVLHFRSEEDDTQNFPIDERSVMPSTSPIPSSLPPPPITMAPPITMPPPTTVPPPTVLDPTMMLDGDDDEEPTHVDPPRAPPSRSDVVPRTPSSVSPDLFPELPEPDDWEIDIDMPRSKRGA